MALLSVLWFIIMNFLVREQHHPLDFYSNQLRTKPHVFLTVLGSLVAAAVVSNQTDQMSLFVKTLPELAIVVYAQGFCIITYTLLKVSAAAAIAASFLYVTLTVSTLLVVMIPTIQGYGWVYSSAFLLINYIWVRWVRTGVKRHLYTDHGKTLCPAGAEVLFQTYDKITKYSTPAILILSDAGFMLVYQLEEGHYGFAVVAAYAFVATVLIVGCSSEFRSGTEVEDAEVV
eukprot:CAMPEP_0206434008 /NCGR_PEP_ID=MMETSP0324_2-20121206/8867_1 /ASSEMBLY_ACC=CAM_ASM_000836 /TAXON_ID=2866 /ORGANISM="Crypthecodinium cohnii, Strain Seligo" /LENGTH=229 /DNA_ID=CAMNT_0053900371 /DNA_START=44 /DNA_END=733 /DNA_ORIENTATION=-